MIIASSDRSFRDSRSVLAFAASSAAVAPRAIVPLIGRVTTCRPSIRRKRSGDAESSHDSGPSFTSAPNGAGFRSTTRRRSSIGPPGQGPSIRCEKLTW